MKFNRIYAFVGLGIMALAYQNCGMQEFGVPKQEPTKPFAEFGNSTTNTSEQALMANIFGARANASKSGACQLIGQATLPLVTHYPQLGAKEAPEIWNSAAVAEFAAGQNYAAVYDISKFPLPQVGSFVANKHGIESFPSGVGDNQSRFEGRLKQLCVGDLASVRFVQGAIEIKAPGDISNLLDENAPYFQILHSVVFKNNLFTIVVPPRWSKATSRTLPTLFNGFYDLNVNFMSLEGQSMFETLAQAYIAKQKSGFAIFWNGNGAAGARSVDNVAYIELNQFLSLFLGDLGPAANKFVTFGSSRGGITALNVASHPAITVASVAFAYSAVAPYELNTVASLTTPTVPMLLSASDWSVGFIGSWQNSFRHPSGFGRVGFQGLTGNEAHVKVLTGSHTASSALRQFNALTSSKTAKLLRNNTQILLEVGSHDFIVPSTDQFRLFIDAMAAGVRLEAKVNYLLGHAHDENYRKTKLETVFNTLLDQTPANSTFVSAGRVSRFVANPNGLLSPLSAGLIYAGNAPLTVELPRYIIDESDPMILATGPANGRYLLVFRKGTEFTKVNLILDSKGLLNLRLPHSRFTAGNYEFYGAYTIDSSDRPLEKVTITSLAPLGLVMTRVVGDIRPYIPSAAGTIMDGIKSQGRYFATGVADGTNYGFLQNGTTAIPVDERPILNPATPSPTPQPVPAVFSCVISNGNLASFTMSGTIRPAGIDTGKVGYYFVAGYDVARKEWWSFDGVNWAKHNGASSSYLPISGASATVLNSMGISGSIFANSDLLSFPNGEIYLGYGIGDTTNIAWSNLMNDGKYKLCATLPSK